MVKEDQKKSAATEKARLKAEHRKIMNEQSTSIRDKEEVKGSTSSSSSSSSGSCELTFLTLLTLTPRQTTTSF